MKFETDPDRSYNWQDGWNSSALFGRILYRNGDECDDNANNKNADVKSSQPLVIKLMPTKSLFKESLILHFVNEIFFYSKVVPFLRSFRNDIDDLIAEFIDGVVHYNYDIAEAALILRNVQSNGYRQPAPGWFLDYHHLSLMVRKLGQFHGYSYVAKAKNDRQFYFYARILHSAFFPITVKFDHIFRLAATRAVRKLESDPKYNYRLSNVHECVEHIGTFIDKTLTPSEKHPFAVLCHGDYLQRNILFKYDHDANDKGDQDRGEPRGRRPNDMKMLDFAGCTLAPPTIDLGFVLYIQADQRMRDEHWDDLLDEYYASVCRTCLPDVQPPTKQQIIDTFKVTCFYSYVVASYFLPEMIATHHHLKSIYDFLPAEYRNHSLDELPKDVWKWMAVDGVGGELSTELLTNILKDMIDRSFI